MKENPSGKNHHAFAAKGSLHHVPHPVLHFPASFLSGDDPKSLYAFSYSLISFRLPTAKGTRWWSSCGRICITRSFPVVEFSG